MTTLYEGAFAKLNLTLDVLDKRPDGFHDIKSIMQTVSIRDDIEIDIGTGEPWSLSCDKEGIPCDHRNLAWKAAELFFSVIAISAVFSARTMTSVRMDSDRKSVSKDWQKFFWNNRHAASIM